MTAVTVRNAPPVLSPGQAGRRYVVCDHTPGNLCGERIIRRLFMNAADGGTPHAPWRIKQSAPRCRAMHDILVNALASIAASGAVIEAIHSLAIIQTR